MRTKNLSTILEQAIALVPDFVNFIKNLDQQVAIKVQRKSMLLNYARRIVLFAIRFGKLPDKVSESLNLGIKHKYTIICGGYINSITIWAKFNIHVFVISITYVLFFVL